MADDQTLMLAFRNRLLTVSGIPDPDTGCAWTNVDFTPVEGSTYLEEDFATTPPQMLSVPSDGGTLETRGVYYARIYAPDNAGAAPIRTITAAILAAFTPGTSFVAGTDAVRVLGQPGPNASAIRPSGAGWAISTVAIPFSVFSHNVVSP